MSFCSICCDHCGMANASSPKLGDILGSVPEHQRHKLDNIGLILILDTLKSEMVVWLMN